ncbi:MAG: Nif3-like dinuclear metal center hexameric protein [Planctomycetota bacterium]
MHEENRVTVADLCEFMNNFAPLPLAEAWDNVGLLLGRKNRYVKAIMTCLTLTEDVAAEAQEQQVDLVITHHPVMFRSLKKLTDETSEGRTLLTLLESGVAVYSPHTAFDSTHSGINQQLAEASGLTQIQPLRPSTLNEMIGAGRLGLMPAAATLQEFAHQLMSVLAIPSLEICMCSNTVQKVAVACGAAAEFLEDAIRLQCDTFITGEARFHSILEARSAGLNLILTGHYASERFAVETLATEITRGFPAIRSFASQSEKNPSRLLTGHGWVSNEAVT